MPILMPAPNFPAEDAGVGRSAFPTAPISAIGNDTIELLEPRMRLECPGAAAAYWKWLQKPDRDFEAYSRSVDAERDAP